MAGYVQPPNKPTAWRLLFHPTTAKPPYINPNPKTIPYIYKAPLRVLGPHNGPEEQLGLIAAHNDNY